MLLLLVLMMTAVAIHNAEAAGFRAAQKSGSYLGEAFCQRSCSDVVTDAGCAKLQCTCGGMGNAFYMLEASSLEGCTGAPLSWSCCVAWPADASAAGAGATGPKGCGLVDCDAASQGPHFCSGVKSTTYSVPRSTKSVTMYYQDGSFGGPDSVVWPADGFGGLCGTSSPSRCAPGDSQVCGVTYDLDSLCRGHPSCGVKGDNGDDLLDEEPVAATADTLETVHSFLDDLLTSDLTVMPTRQLLENGGECGINVTVGPTNVTSPDRQQTCGDSVIAYLTLTADNVEWISLPAENGSTTYKMVAISLPPPYNTILNVTNSSCTISSRVANPTVRNGSIVPYQETVTVVCPQPANFDNATGATWPVTGMSVQLAAITKHPDEPAESCGPREWLTPFIPLATPQLTVSPSVTPFQVCPNTTEFSYTFNMIWTDTLGFASVAVTFDGNNSVCDVANVTGDLSTPSGTGNITVTCIVGALLTGGSHTLALTVAAVTGAYCPPLTITGQATVVVPPEPSVVVTPLTPNQTLGCPNGPNITVGFSVNATGTAGPIVFSLVGSPAAVSQCSPPASITGSGNVAVVCPRTLPLGANSIALQATYQAPGANCPASSVTSPPSTITITNPPTLVITPGAPTLSCTTATSITATFGFSVALTAPSFTATANSTAAGVTCFASFTSLTGGNGTVLVSCTTTSPSGFVPPSVPVILTLVADDASCSGITQTSTSSIPVQLCSPVTASYSVPTNAVLGRGGACLPYIFTSGPSTCPRNAVAPITLPRAYLQYGPPSGQTTTGVMRQPSGLGASTCSGTDVGTFAVTCTDAGTRFRLTVSVNSSEPNPVANTRVGVACRNLGNTLPVTGSNVFTECIFTWLEFRTGTPSQSGSTTTATFVLTAQNRLQPFCNCASIYYTVQQPISASGGAAIRGATKKKTRGF